MRRLVLIRHAATDLAGTFCGHSDPDLNPAGLAQLHAVRRRLDSCPLDRLLSSDLLRARRCAQVLAHQHRLQPMLDPALREINFGDWEGLRWDEIQARFPEQAQRWLHDFTTFTPPHAEPYAHFTARIRKQADQWLLETSPTTCLAVLTHRGVLQFLLQTYCGVEAAAAGQLVSRYATVLFCARTDGGEAPLALEETWHPD